MEVNITQENFVTEVLGYSGTVIVDFYGTWCMPCKMLAPTVEKVSRDLNIKLAKVDIDENNELIKKFKIVSVPTLKIFKNGEEIANSVGLISEKKLIELINQ